MPMSTKGEDRRFIIPGLCKQCQGSYWVSWVVSEARDIMRVDCRVRSGNVLAIV